MLSFSGEPLIWPSPPLVVVALYTHRHTQLFKVPSGVRLACLFLLMLLSSMMSDADNDPQTQVATNMPIRDAGCFGSSGFDDRLT